jgi:large subunit ribosomal protein L21
MLAWGENMYAVVETGGKQYRVTPGQVVQVERLQLETGSQVELDRVLLVADGEDRLVGRPLVEGAKVLAEALGEEKEDKVIVFKYKPKVRYRRKKGHRHLYTNLAIKQILLEKETKHRSHKMEESDGT